MHYSRQFFPTPSARSFLLGWRVSSVGGGCFSFYVLPWTWVVVLEEEENRTWNAGGFRYILMGLLGVTKAVAVFLFLFCLIWYLCRGGGGEWLMWIAGFMLLRLE